MAHETIDPNTRIIRVYKEAGYLIPAEVLTEDEIHEAKTRFRHMFYDQKACKKCDNLPERHNELCDNCASFQGGRALAKLVEVDEAPGRTFLSLPYGATRKVRRYLKSLGSEYRVKSVLQETADLSRPIKFRSHVKLKEWQEEAVAAAIEAKKGVVEAPPRAGKTVFGAAVVMELNGKTIILASQRDWLLQFQETFIGSDTVEPFTTARPRQVRMCKTYADFVNTDVCLATFQQFMKPKGRKLLERIRHLFRVLIVDEVHFSPSLQSSRVLSRFATEYRFGLTGTPARKTEGLYEVVNELMGPVFYRAKVEVLKPKVELLMTNLPFEIKQAPFHTFLNRLEYNKARLTIVAKAIHDAIQAGHTVLCPMARTKAMFALVRMVNELAEEKVVLPFFGGLRKDERKRAIEAARTGEIKGLIGQIRLLSTGLNIPRASYLVEATVSSNLPNCQQRTSRILTPMEGKLQPTILYVLDESGIMRNMRRTEWWQCVYPKFNPIMRPDVRAQFMAWLGGGKGQSKSYGRPDI